jgi:O-6-methylguanine DNA methyltransferase
MLDQDTRENNLNNVVNANKSVNAKNSVNIQNPVNTLLQAVLSLPPKGRIEFLNKGWGEAQQAWAEFATEFGSMAVVVQGDHLQYVGLGNVGAEQISCVARTMPAAPKTVLRVLRWAIQLCEQREPLPVALGGTDFQQSVWQALSMVPPGRTCTYQGLAAAIGREGSARAVGSALGANALALFLPCHRVVRADGGLGGLGWGLPLKRRLLAYERGERLTV